MSQNTDEKGKVETNNFNGEDERDKLIPIGKNDGERLSTKNEETSSNEKGDKQQSDNGNDGDSGAESEENIEILHGHDDGDDDDDDDDDVILLDRFRDVERLKKQSLVWGVIITTCSFILLVSSIIATSLVIWLKVFRNYEFYGGDLFVYFACSLGILTLIVSLVGFCSGVSCSQKKYRYFFSVIYLLGIMLLIFCCVIVLCYGANMYRLALNNGTSEGSHWVNIPAYIIITMISFLLLLIAGICCFSCAIGQLRSVKEEMRIADNISLFHQSSMDGIL